MGLHNDLTIDASAPFAADPERYCDAFAASLVLSMLFHDQVIFLDTNLINNPGLRKIAELRPNIIECLHGAPLEIALRTGVDSLGQLMESMSRRRAFHPHFRTVDDYLSGVPFAQSFNDKVSGTIRYDVDALAKA